MDVLKGRITQHIERSQQTFAALEEACGESIFEAAQLIANTFRADGKLMICGNGGSAADSQHLAAEFVSRLTADFERPGLAALALTTDTSFLTAYGNDFGFEGVFRRQVQALGKPEDCLLGISTSGNSGNILLAIDEAKSIGIKTIALCGQGGKMAESCDVCIAVPSTVTQYIQEAHLCVEHILCDVVERMLYPQE